MDARVARALEGRMRANGVPVARGVGAAAGRVSVAKLRAPAEVRRRVGRSLSDRLGVRGTGLPGVELAVAVVLVVWWGPVPSVVALAMLAVFTVAGPRRRGRFPACFGAGERTRRRGPPPCAQRCARGPGRARVIGRRAAPTRAHHRVVPGVRRRDHASIRGRASNPLVSELVADPHAEVQAGRRGDRGDEALDDGEDPGEAAEADEQAQRRDGQQPDASTSWLRTVSAGTVAGAGRSRGPTAVVNRDEERVAPGPSAALHPRAGRGSGSARPPGTRTL